MIELLKKDGFEVIEFNNGIVIKFYNGYMIQTIYEEVIVNLQKWDTLYYQDINLGNFNIEFVSEPIVIGEAITSLHPSHTNQVFNHSSSPISATQAGVFRIVRDNDLVNSINLPLRLQRTFFGKWK